MCSADLWTVGSTCSYTVGSTGSCIVGTTGSWTVGSTGSWTVGSTRECEKCSKDTEADGQGVRMSDSYFAWPEFDPL